MPLSPVAGTPPSVPGITIITRDGFECVLWEVDGQKLNSNDKHIISPIVNSALGKFKLMIHPSTGEQSGGDKPSTRAPNFMKAKGKGIISVKCESLGGNEGAEPSAHDAKATKCECRWNIGAFSTEDEAKAD